jgi:hypothetical protein
MCRFPRYVEPHFVEIKGRAFCGPKEGVIL